MGNPAALQYINMYPYKVTVACLSLHSSQVFGISVMVLIAIISPLSGCLCGSVWRFNLFCVHLYPFHVCGRLRGLEKVKNISLCLSRIKPFFCHYIVVGVDFESDIFVTCLPTRYQGRCTSNMGIENNVGGL